MRPTPQSYANVKSVCQLASVLLCLLFIALSTHAQSGPSLLLRNAMIMDPAGETTSVNVSLLVTGGILELVTADDIDRPEGVRSYDAAKGFVLGALNLGEPASFMILNGDPRKDVSLILDTKQYSDFAVYKGDVVRNSLAPHKLAQNTNNSQNQRRWLAYTPVPPDYSIVLNLLTILAAE